MANIWCRLSPSLLLILCLICYKYFSVCAFCLALSFFMSSSLILFLYPIIFCLSLSLIFCLSLFSVCLSLSASLYVCLDVSLLLFCLTSNFAKAAERQCYFFFLSLSYFPNIYRVFFSFHIYLIPFIFIFLSDSHLISCTLSLCVTVSACIFFSINFI